MTPAELQQYLSETYEVLCFENLADHNRNTGSLYRLFAQHHRQCYSPNQRLVLYTNGSPSDQLIAHLKRAADVVDISRCFILICGDVVTAKSDDIEFFGCEIETNDLRSDNLIDLNTFCPVPFSHMAVMEQGRVKTCCVYETTFGSAMSHSLSELFYGAHLSKVRQDFIENKKSPGCKVCWDLEQQNMESNRQWHLKFYEKQAFVDQWIENPMLRSIDLRPSNICNFKCRICNPMSSSLYATESLQSTQDPAQQTKIKDIIKKGQWFDHDPEFFQQLTDHLPHMVQIDFYGGEPFLLKQLPRLLQTAIDLGVAKNIRLHFNTNASIWPEKLIPLLCEFRAIDIALSIDNTGKKFELERGGDWETVELNIKKFAGLESKFNCYLMPTISVQNVFYLPELFGFAQNLGLRVHCNFVEDPAYLSIDRLTDAAKALVIPKLEAQTNPVLHTIAQRIKQSSGSDGSEFRLAMFQFDSKRGQDFRNTHFEIANAMGYML